MKQCLVKTSSPEEFFKRGRKIAKLADSGAPISEQTILSFEDPADLLKLLTPARLAVFQAARDQPGSISAISMRLMRDRSAVKRDIDVLENAGLLKVDSLVLPGHGRLKQVRLAARKIRLTVRLA